MCRLFTHIGAAIVSPQNTGGEVRLDLQSRDICRGFYRWEINFVIVLFFCFYQNKETKENSITNHISIISFVFVIIVFVFFANKTLIEELKVKASLDSLFARLLLHALGTRRGVLAGDL